MEGDAKELEEGREEERKPGERKKHIGLWPFTEASV